MPAENPPQQPDLAANLFEGQHVLPGLKRHGSPRIDEQHEPELRLRFYRGWQGKGKDSAHRISIGPHSTTNNNRAPQGTTAGQTDGAYSKQNELKTSNEPPTPDPGRQGGVEGGEQAEEEARAGPNITYH